MSTEELATSGQDGQYALIDLDYQNDVVSVPSRVFAKILCLAPERRTGFFVEQQRREQHFYAEFSGRVAARVPEYYYGDYCLSDPSGVLVIEPLDGWRPGSIVDGISLPEAHAAARELGLLNGSTMDEGFLRGPHPFLEFAAAGPLVKQLQEGYDTSVEKHETELRSLLTPELWRTAQSLVGRTAPLLAEIKSGDRSINHGDCRVDNMAFRQIGDRLEAVIFDFGLTTIGNGLPDLAHAIASSLRDSNVEDYKTVVNTYWHALNAAGHYQGSFAELWHAFRSAMLFAFIARTFSLRSFENLASLHEGSELERMRITAWQRVAATAHMLRLWEVA